MSYESAIDFLKDLARTKRLSQSEIAKKSKLSDAQVSRIFSMESIASDESLVALALAVGNSPDNVLRIAGRLPPKPDTDPLTEEGIYILERLEGEELEEAVRQLRLRQQVAEERGKYDTRKRKTRPAEPG